MPTKLDLRRRFRTLLSPPPPHFSALHPAASAPDLTALGTQDLPTASRSPSAAGSVMPKQPQPPVQLLSSSAATGPATTAETLPGSPPGVQEPHPFVPAGHGTTSTAITASMTPQPPDNTIQNPQRNPVPTILAPSGSSLWEQAFKKLPEDIRAAFPFTDTDKKQYIEDILKATKESRDTCQRDGLKFNFRGKDIIVRDIAERLLSWVEKFKAVGDAAVQYDPVHAALPWAGVRFLLQIAINNKETMEVVLVGIERITRIIIRCDFYESQYLAPNLALTVAKNLGDALVELYSAILDFLAFAMRYLVKSSTRKMFHGFLDVEGKSRFGSIENQESLLLKEVDVAEAEVRKHDHATIDGRTEKLRDMLQDMEKPIARINFNVELMYNKFRRHVEDGRRAEILQWLSNIEYEKNHQTAKETLLDNTGQWLRDKKEFVGWRSSSASSILWLHGIPGAGKTKLTCAVIDFLQSVRLQHEPVVYFYCNRNDAPRREPEILMQAIVKQLSVVYTDLPDPVVAMFDDRKKGSMAGGTLGFGESRDLVISLLNIYSQTTIVIDALDETNPDERWKLLEALEVIIHSSSSLVKIFVSSRDDQDIKLQLEQVPNLYIGANDNHEDIERFVLREVTGSIRRKRLLHGDVTDELKTQIISTITNGAGGMFQWADLQIKHLYTLRLPEDVKDSLGKLPKTLGDTYSQILLRMSSQTPREKELTRRALMWIMCARNPLGKKGWAEATYWPELVSGSGAAILFDLCCNLVTWDEQLDRVVFSHLSVQEYLESRSFSSMDAHCMAAGACLSVFEDSCYLLRLWDLNRTQSLSSVENAGFRLYSTIYWADHIKSSYAQCIGKRELDLLVRFLGAPAKPSEAYCTWLAGARLVTWRGDSVALSGLCHQVSETSSPLFAMSYFDFGGALLEIWKYANVDTNCINYRGETPLFVAIEAGNDPLVDFLLERGADVNAGESDLAKNPLMRAIALEQPNIVAKLLDAEASISANGCSYRSTLEAVLKHGGDLVLGMLLSRDPNIKMGKRSLEWAVGGWVCRKKVVDMVLSIEPGVKITSNALERLAAEWGCTTELIEVLLCKQPDVGVTEAFFLRSRRDHMRTMLSSNANIQVSQAVLNYTAGRDTVEVVREVLSKFPNPGVTGGTLEAAAGNFYSDVGVMELFLSMAPNTEITAATLHAAASNSGYGRGFGILRVLLSMRSNIHITGAVMRRLARRGYEEPMKLLLSYDSNIPITEAILEAAASNKRRGDKVMQLLLSYDPNILVTEAILEAAASNKRRGDKVMELLLSYDPNIAITEAILEAAASNKRRGDKVIELLLSSDHNISITEAILEEAACNSSCGDRVLEILLQRACNIRATEAALNAAASNAACGYRAMKLLLSIDSNIIITEATLMEAAGNRESGGKVMELLLSSGCSIEVTSLALERLVYNPSIDEKIIELLLSGSPNTMVTEWVLEAAIQNRGHAKGITEVLLSRNPKIRITEGILVEAALVRGTWDIAGGRGVIEVLLSRIPNIRITEAILETTIGNIFEGKEIMGMLLSKCTDIKIPETVLGLAETRDYYGTKMILGVVLSSDVSIEITEGAMAKVAGRFDEEIMAKLLSKCPTIEITGATMEAAAGNWGSGKEIIELLLAREPNIKITEAVLMSVAKKFDEEIMAKLLSRTPETAITEAILVAAAGNRGCGNKIIDLLLSTYPNLEITEAVLGEAAAGCLNSGKEVIEVLLSRCPNIEVTEAVLGVAAGNIFQGKQIMEVLLSKRPNIVITDAVLEAAERNKRSGKEIMYVLRQALQS